MHIYPKKRIPLSFILARLEPSAIRSRPRAATISLTSLKTDSGSTNWSAYPISNLFRVLRKPERRRTPSGTTLVLLPVAPLKRTKRLLTSSSVYDAGSAKPGGGVVGVSDISSRSSSPPPSDEMFCPWLGVVSFISMSVSLALGFQSDGIVAKG